ncbi:glutathione S-transferase family protein [Marinobacterium sp. D7]|uniref:glutathione S-transferase family protein n=1 Tax=Marinobacterium ramblicola TaxID=2849041 RepID=UPI001C2DA037|nr:glutathione S-transferase family protein [Marinobacterium ramblicola]MBV1788704.1 glutathione S-transferase family protein [Marinobacterium ramblicola]
MSVPYTLYYAPGACSRVTLAALEQTGARYTARPVLLAQGEQNRADYLTLNPKGKVPTLVTAEGVLTETLAIALYLHHHHPNAGLLPHNDAYAQARACAWLSWCGTTLHPLIYRLRMTGRIHPDGSLHGELKRIALEELCLQLQVAEQALAGGRHWIDGPRWTLADLYLLWIWQRALQAGCNPIDYPALRAWAQRTAAIPAWQRALASE